MPFKHQPPFDPARDFVVMTFFRAGGVVYELGAPFDKDGPGITAHVLKLLYNSHKIAFADSTDDEKAATFAPVTITEQGGGWYEVNAPWLDTPEKVQGRGPAELRAGQLRDEGEPDEHHGVVLMKGDGGWYTINALWLDEPEKVQGHDAAYDRATALRKEGAPAGWVDKSGLLGADGFEASYTFGDETVAIADIIAAARAASGHDGAVWNAMDAETRSSLIQTELDRRGPAPTEATAGTDETPPEAPASIETPESETAATDDEKAARIKALVDGNTAEQLATMAEGLEGVKASSTKGDLAALIVDAGRDAKAGDGGAA